MGVQLTIKPIIKEPDEFEDNMDFEQEVADIEEINAEPETDSWITMTDLTIRDYHKRDLANEAHALILARDVKELELSGSFHIQDAGKEVTEVLKLAKWSKVAAHDEDCYRRLELEATGNNNEVYDQITIENAFVVSFEQSLSVEKGNISYTILIREYDDTVKFEEWDRPAVADDAKEYASNIEPVMLAYAMEYHGYTAKIDESSKRTANGITVANYHLLSAYLDYINKSFANIPIFMGRGIIDRQLIALHIISSYHYSNNSSAMFYAPGDVAIAYAIEQLNYKDLQSITILAQKDGARWKLNKSPTKTQLEKAKKECKNLTVYPDASRVYTLRRIGESLEILDYSSDTTHNFSNIVSKCTHQNGGPAYGYNKNEVGTSQSNSTASGFIPSNVYLLTGRSNQEVNLKKEIDRVNNDVSNMREWTQELINRVWEECNHFNSTYNIQIDPRLMLAIIAKETNGSWNTSSKNRAADKQHGAMKNFENDLANALDVVGGKALAYTALHASFSDARQKAYNENKPGISNYDDFLMYLNWSTPRLQLLSKGQLKGEYAGNNTWHRGVRQFYSDFASSNIASEYTEYLKSLGRTACDNACAKLNISLNSYTFDAIMNGQHADGSSNNEYTISAR